MVQNGMTCNKEPQLDPSKGLCGMHLNHQSPDAPILAEAEVV